MFFAYYSVFCFDHTEELKIRQNLFWLIMSLMFDEHRNKMRKWFRVSECCGFQTKLSSNGEEKTARNKRKKSKINELRRIFRKYSKMHEVSVDFKTLKGEEWIADSSTKGSNRVEIYFDSLLFHATITNSTQT